MRVLVESLLSEKVRSLFRRAASPRSHLGRQTTPSTTTQSVSIHLSSIISIPHHPRPLSFFLRHIRRLRLGLIILQRAAACSCAHCHCQIVVLGSPASSARCVSSPYKPKPISARSPTRTLFASGGAGRSLSAAKLQGQERTTPESPTRHYLHLTHPAQPSARDLLLEYLLACLLKTTCGTANKARSAAALHTKTSAIPTPAALHD